MAEPLAKGPSRELQDARSLIADHLDAIATLFKNPKLTIVVRAPDLDDGDLIITNDDLAQVIAVIARLKARERVPADEGRAR